jgi:hypothetical protein
MLNSNIHWAVEWVKWIRWVYHLFGIGTAQIWLAACYSSVRFQNSQIFQIKRKNEKPTRIKYIPNLNFNCWFYISNTFINIHWIFLLVMYIWLRGCEGRKAGRINIDDKKSKKKAKSNVLKTRERSFSKKIRLLCKIREGILSVSKEKLKHWFSKLRRSKKECMTNRETKQ